MLLRGQPRDCSLIDITNAVAKDTTKRVQIFYFRLMLE